MSTNNERRVWCLFDTKQNKIVCVDGTIAWLEEVDAKLALIQRVTINRPDVQVKQYRIEDIDNGQKEKASLGSGE